MNEQVKAALRERLQVVFDKMYLTLERTGDFDEATAINGIFATLQPEIERLVVEGKLKQTRRILQHEEDVWGVSRNKSYLDSEINKLKTQLTQQDPKEVV